MSAASATVQDVQSGVSVIDRSGELSTFLRPDCAAAVWNRQTPTQMRTWLDQLDPERLPSGRVILHASAVSDTVQHLFDIADLPAGPERDWLHDDIVSLAHLFSDLMSAQLLRLRLDVVTTNACRKFHVDAIMGRLVCTYRGTGTQYGVADGGQDPSRIFTVPTGAPILLRGTLWPETPATGVLHRSPPIEGTGETRLVLVLDPIFDPEDGV